MARIRLSDFKNVSQAKLLPFSKNVIDKVKDNANYADAAKEIAAVETTYTTFNKALADAQDGGKSRTKEKNNAKTELVNALSNLASRLETLRPNDDLYYVKAGYSVREKAVKHEGKVAPPSTVTTSISVKPGTTNLKIEITSRIQLLIFLIEYRIAGTGEWINYGSSSQLSFQLENLPSDTNIVLRVRSLGTGINNHSDWVISNEVQII